jgi:xanthine dehydrogenase accessory factor
LNEWIDELSEQIAGGNPCVLVTVAGIRGSAPREVGAKMIVTDREAIGTIGGGQLEYKCTQIACSALRNHERASRIRKFSLGANCGQCCGGVVDVLFEPIVAEKPAWLDELQTAHGRREAIVIATDSHNKYLIAESGDCVYPPNCAVDEGLLVEALHVLSDKKSARMVKLNLNGSNDGDVLLEPVVTTDLNIAVFGAGHVGAATVNTLSSLDCDIRWIDGRRNVFPQCLPKNVQRIESDRPALEVSAMPAGTYYLVMTHSHPLDQEIIQQILARDDFAYCGLIGSVSKRRRFEKRLRKLGMTQSRIDKITCPIGIDGIDGKKPAEIAISVAAELLQIVNTETRSIAEDLPDNVRILRQ